MTPNPTTPPSGTQAMTACPVCRSGQTRVFYTQTDVPCQDGIIWATREQARSAPRGDIELTHCRACGHVFNGRFDPSKFVFDSSYNVSLHHSPAYKAYIDDLVHGLVERHALAGKTVVEIGCGQADFLKAICVPYLNRGIGFDPTFTDECLTAADRQSVTVHAENYTPASGIAGDLVVLRSMLQSVTDPRTFLAGVKPALASAGATVYAEVPNSQHVFEKLSIWNIVYEDGCFFGRTSLTRLFMEAGLAVQDCFACWAEDQNLGIEAGLKPSGRAFAFDLAEVERFGKVIDRFAHEHHVKLCYWRNTLDRLQTKGKRLAMWGAGARAQAFCNLFEISDDTLPYIVDINPYRQGRFMPKTLQQVVPPETLKADPPDVVLITNSGYAPEIKRQIGELGVRCETMVLD